MANSSRCSNNERRIQKIENYLEHLENMIKEQTVNIQKIHKKISKLEEEEVKNLDAENTIW